MDKRVICKQVQNNLFFKMQNGKFIPSLTVSTCRSGFFAKHLSVCQKRKLN